MASPEKLPYAVALEFERLTAPFIAKQKRREKKSRRPRMGPPKAHLEGRDIKPLISLEFVDFSEPPGIESGARRGAAAKGIAFERKAAKELARRAGAGAVVYAGQWLRFVDGNEGPGFAQPDCFIVQDSRVLIYECKLTQCRRAEVQLTHRYGPLLRKLFPDRALTLIQVARNVTGEPITGQRLRDPLSPPPGGVHLWHYLG